MFDDPHRRAVLGSALALAFAPTLALARPKGLTFAVLRNGAHIGQHHMAITGGDDDLTVTTDVGMTVKLGPVPVYRYRHHAVETWAGGRFQRLSTTTNGNGKLQKVSAQRGASSVEIQCATGAITAPANAAPFTHWNPKVFTGPLFNPQEGKLLKVTASRVGDGHWAIRGESEIDDWYDAEGSWTALKGKLKDGSAIEYRRV